MKSSPFKTKPATIKAPRLVVGKSKSPGKALLAVSRTSSTSTTVLPSSSSAAALAIDSTASKSSLTKRITLPCPTGSSSTMNNHPVVEPTVTPLTPVTGSIPSGTGTESQPLAPTPPTTRSVWYLGGNQIIKLLTSVDGDLDHAVLANIADVPSVVGDLALSVESLVSDDFTVGGFETDLLAKIAANTLAAKRASIILPPPLVGPPPPVAALSDLTPSSPVPDSPLERKEDRSPLHHQPLLLPCEDDPMTITTMTTTDSSEDHQYQDQQQQQQQLMTFDSVPNPLADYQPVPNPLARITPPPSPLITIDNKPTEVTIPTTAEAQLIQAR